MYITASEPTSEAYFINASHQSARLSVYIARQRLNKKVTAAKNTHIRIEELLDSSFLCGPCRIEGKCGLFLQRTSYLFSMAYLTQSVYRVITSWAAEKLEFDSS